MQNILRDLLLELLSKKEVDAFFARVKRIIASIKDDEISYKEEGAINKFN
jgi:hypothetical protein